MLSDKIIFFFFFFLMEDKVAFNEKKQKQMDTLKYLSIIIKMFYIFKKKT